MEQAQARVVATIEAKHTEFVAAFDQIGELQGTVARLQSDLKSATAFLGASSGPSGAGREPIGSKLREAVHEHAALSSELESLDAAAKVLSVMLEVQKQFDEFDQLINSAHYCDAGELSTAVARLLQSISAPDESSEPSMLRAAKAQYYQRRAILTTRLENALGQLVTFGERSATARRSTLGAAGQEPRASDAVAPTTLREVWDALGILGLRDRRVEQLADQANRLVLRPLLEAARRLPAGSRLKPIVSPGQDATSWTWADSSKRPDADPGQTQGARRLSDAGAPRPQVQVVLPALESLLAFAYEHWAGESSDVYLSIGRRLWPVITRCLLQHFECCKADDGQAVERFELSMFSKGFTKGRETLSRHVHEHRHALGEQRRALALSEARSWLLKEDGVLVEVCDKDEPGSITQLLQQMGGDSPSRAALSAASAGLDAQDAGASIGGIGERLQYALKDDEGLLRLPLMKVSASTHQLVARIRELMEEMVTAIEQGRTEVARDLNKLARELCTLFAVLRPFVQKAQLKASSRCCAVFLADCLYLVHVLILMPYSYGKRVSPELQQLTFFIDLVPQLRRLGENHFLSMLRHHQEQLAAALRPCDMSAGLAKDRVFVTAEAALGAAVQQLKSAVQGLAVALPPQLLREVSGLLVGMLCRDLLSKLFAVQQLEPEEVGCASTLLSSALAMSRQIFFLAGIDGNDVASTAAAVPGWSALTCVIEVLGSDLSRFMERRGVLLKVLAKDEVIKLMQLSLRDELLTPHEAWEALNAGAS